MKITRAHRQSLGLVLLAFFALYNLASLIREIGILSPSEVDNDKMTEYLHRFDSMRDTVKHYEVVGYVDDAAYSAGWFQAQYALAPTILVQGTDREIVVVNLHVDSSEARTTVERELQLIRDYGGGVRLYRGRSR